MKRSPVKQIKQHNVMKKMKKELTQDQSKGPNQDDQKAKDPSKLLRQVAVQDAHQFQNPRTRSQTKVQN